MVTYESTEEFLLLDDGSLSLFSTFQFISNESAMIKSEQNQSGKHPYF